MSEDGPSDDRDATEPSTPSPGSDDQTSGPQGVPSDVPPSYGWKDTPDADPLPGETPRPNKSS